MIKRILYFETMFDLIIINLINPSFSKRKPAIYIYGTKMGQKNYTLIAIVPKMSSLLPHAYEKSVLPYYTDTCIYITGFHKSKRGQAKVGIIHRTNWTA